jgi:dCMP deaminase
MDRPDKTMYFLDIALAVAARSTCMRRKFGAVIVNGNTIVGTGYNGTAKGVINCHEVGCVKDVMDLPQDSAYDYCPAVHAEENAIINSNRADRIGSKLYLAGLDADDNYTKAVPCQRCRRKIINSEIEEVVILDSNGEPVAYNVEDWKQEDSDWYIGQLESLGVKVPKQTKLDVMKANEP